MKKLSKLLSLVLALIMLIAPVDGIFSLNAEAAGKWVCSWATSTVNSSVSVATVSLQDIIPAKSTIRIELKVTTGGNKLRFKFSNEYGSAAITFNEVAVAKTVGEGNAAIKANTSTLITFNGNKSVTIPKGKTVWSDTIDFSTEALDALSVSVYFASPTYITSAGLSNARTFMSVGSLFGEGVSQCSTATLSDAREVNISSSTITYHTTPFLCAIDTYDSTGTKAAAVFIGDSTLVNDTYYYFAEKLVKAGITNVSVVNEAVVANKLLSDGTGLIGNLYGDALIERFERDALNVSGVKYIFVKIGLNDILHQFSKSMGADVPHPTAADIIEGYKTLVKMAHAKGIKIYFFTKSPWKGYERAFLGQSGDITWTKEMQKMCDELDEWIMNNTVADGYIDCSPLRNPADKYALCPSFTSDGAHLTPLASIALADLIPVSYVGVTNTDIKTAAKIHKVDPYKEKKQIQNEIDNPTEATTEPPMTEPTTQRQEETTAKQEPSTTEPAGDTTYPTYNNGEIVTVPVIGGTSETLPYSGGLQVNPNYNISDNLPSSVGDGKNLSYILIVFAVLTASGLVVFFTMARKKEEEFE